jgi:hypothetical protein
VLARKRPNAFVPPEVPSQYYIRFGHKPHEFRSLLGGHAANAFACATYYSQRFHLSVLEPVLYVYATGIALGRIADRYHWTSDQLVGSAFGIATGRLVARRQLQRRAERERKRTSSTARYSFEPMIADDGQGVVLGGRITF